MYNYEDVLIIGDSFCAQRTRYDHWPKLLYSELTNDDYNVPRGNGYMGCSWWSVRKNLLDELKIHIPKILIICHTEYGRIPNDNNLPLNPSVGLHKKYSLLNLLVNDELSYKNYASATDLYYKHLYSEKFHLWAVQEWFHELDDILEKYNIEKIIHIYCFLNTYKLGKMGKLYQFRNGLTINDYLDRYSTSYFEQRNKLTDVKLPNHLTFDNNIKLAHNLKNIILDKYVDGGLYDNRLLDGKW